MQDGSVLSNRDAARSGSEQPSRLFTLKGAPAVRRILENAGWQETPRSDWHLYWRPQVPSHAVYHHLGAEMQVNHLPGIGALTSRRLLHRTLAATADVMSGRSGALNYDYLPPTFVLPEELVTFRRAAVRAPGTRWVRKPVALSLDRETRVLDRTDDVGPASECWLQQLVEPRHRVDGQSYKVRLFALISSVDPLRAYLHCDGRIRTQSGASLPLADYLDRLQTAGHDPQALMGELKRIVTATLIAGHQVMVHTMSQHRRQRPACFELLAMDFAIQEDLQCWLLGCKLSPELEGTGSLVSDTLALVGAVPRPAAGSAANEPPMVASAAGDSLEQTLVQEAAAELGRCGGFERLIPGADPAAMLQWFPLPRYADVVLARALSPELASWSPRLEPRGASLTFLDKEVVVFSEHSRQFHLPNPTGGFIWLRTADGASPDTIADELSAQFGKSTAETRQDVWGALARWVQGGLLRQRGDEPPQSLQRRPLSDPALDEPAWTSLSPPHTLRAYGLDGCDLCVGYADAGWATQVDPVLGAPTERAAGAAEHWIEIEAAERGLRLRMDDGSEVLCRGDAWLAPLVRAYLWQSACAHHDGVVAVRGAVVALNGEATLLPGHGGMGTSLLAAALTARGFDCLSAEAGLIEREAHHARRVPGALEIYEEDAVQLASSYPGLETLPLHRLPSEFGVKYLTLPDPSDAPASLPVRSLVFVRRADHVGARSTLSVVDRREALELLTSGGFDVRPELTSARAAELVDWLETIDCWELELGDLEQAAALMRRVLA